MLQIMEYVITFQVISDVEGHAQIFLNNFDAAKLIQLRYGPIVRRNLMVSTFVKLIGYEPNPY